jgi:hypothetical protein
MKLLDIIFESVVEGKQLYTDDDIEKEAKKKDEEDNYVYKQREDFKRGSYWAWRAASQRGILDKVCDHMKPPTKGSKFEKTDDEVRNEIKRKDINGNYIYKTTNQLKNECPWAYNAAKNRKRLGGLNKVCDHMVMSKYGIKKTDPNYEEKIADYNQRNTELGIVPKNSDEYLNNLLRKGEDAAKKYDSPVIFQTKEPVLYQYLSDAKLLPKIAHIYKKHKIRDKYSYEDLKNIILKKYENGEYVYKTKRDLEQGNLRAYNTAYESPYWEELTAHMIPLGNKYNRMVYVYKFPEVKTVYVGLTGDEDRRKGEHQTDPVSALYKFMVKNPGLVPIYEKETLGYIDEKEASKKESEVEYKYRNDGWTLLNVAKTGGLGKTFKYTDQLFRTIAKNYSVLSDFWRDHRKMVNTVKVHRNKLYNQVTKKMLKNIQPSQIKNDKNFNLFLNSKETDISQLNLINFTSFYLRVTPKNRNKFLKKLRSIVKKNNLKLSGNKYENTILSTNKLLYNGLTEHDKKFPTDKFIPYLFPDHVNPKERAREKLLPSLNESKLSLIKTVYTI